MGHLDGYIFSRPPSHSLSLLLHTYLVTQTWIKKRVSHVRASTLHSVAGPGITSPSGAVVAQFLLAFLWDLFFDALGLARNLRKSDLITCFSSLLLLDRRSEIQFLDALASHGVC